MQSSVYKKVGIASLIMMGSVFLSRIVGVLRESVLAFAGGAGGDVDAYLAAFSIPELLNHVVATGFLSITFIPIFSRYLVEEKEEESWQVFSLIFAVFGFFLICLVVPACIWADRLVGYFVPGITDPEKLALVVRMTRIVLPAQVLFFFGGLFMAVQFAKERFLFPAMAPLIYNLGIILGGLLLGPVLGIEGFAWGVVAGALIGSFALQWVGAKQVGMRFSFCLNLRHPALKQYFLLTLPLMLSLTMNFSTEFFFRFFGSFMKEGTIAALNYGLRVLFVLVGIFGQAIGTAIYPFMSRLAAEGRLDEMNDLLNRTLRYLSLVIPFSILFMVLRHEIVQILFQRGRFDTAAAALTSQLLPYLLIGAFAFSAQTVVVRGFYATKDMLFPAIFSTIAVLVSLPFYWLGMEWLGPAGVALGVSFSALLQVIFLYVAWNRRSDNAGSKDVYRHVIKIILLGSCFGVVLEGVKKTALIGFNSSSFSGALLMCVVLGILFLLLLFAVGKILRIHEIDEILMKPWCRLKGQ